MKINKQNKATLRFVFAFLSLSSLSLSVSTGKFITERMHPQISSRGFDNPEQIIEKPEKRAHFPVSYFPLFYISFILYFCLIFFSQFFLLLLHFLLRLLYFSLPKRLLMLETLSKNSDPK